MPSSTSSIPCDNRLMPDEVLVRDGTGKLVLCWAAVCLAHRAQIFDEKFAEGPREKAIRLLAVLRATSERQGLHSLPATRSEDAGMRSPMKWSFVESLHHKEWNATLTDMAEVLAERNGHVQTPLIVNGLKDQSWFQFNGIAYDIGSLRALRRCAAKGANGKPEDLRKAKPLLRFLWGSAQSIERISVAAYDAGISSLNAFDETANDDDKRASPLPLDLVKRWARVLGILQDFLLISDVEPRASSVHLQEASGAWETFCGRTEILKTGEQLYGGTLQEFAASFEALLGDPSYFTRLKGLAHTGAEKVKLSPGRTPEIVDGRKDQVASDAPDQKSRSNELAAKPPRLVAQHDPRADRDDIAMTIDSAPQSSKVVIEDIEYCIDPELRDGADRNDTRLCTRKLVLEWQWDSADAVFLRGSRTDRIRAVKRDNPGLILNLSFDSLFVRITISAPPGEVLPPSFEVAVDRLVLPDADIIPGTMHRFSLSLPDSAVMFGRLDVSTGRYCCLETEEGQLQKPSRIAATLIEELDARIRNRLEPDRTGSIPLGRRIALAAHPIEGGVP